jgi:hypothetical protein
VGGRGDGPPPTPPVEKKLGAEAKMLVFVI